MHGIEIEGGDDIGVDVQYPGEDSPRRYHAQTLSIPAFYIDKYPVTNRQFADFLEAANYHPRTSTISSRIGTAASTPPAGRTGPSPGYRWKMRAPTPVGPASGCRTNGNGSMPPRAWTAGCTRGEAPGATSALPGKSMGGISAGLRPWMRSPKGRARSA